MGYSKRGTDDGHRISRASSYLCSSHRGASPRRGSRGGRRRDHSLSCSSGSPSEHVWTNLPEIAKRVHPGRTRRGPSWRPPASGIHLYLRYALSPTQLGSRIHSPAYRVLSTHDIRRGTSCQLGGGTHVPGRSPSCRTRHPRAHEQTIHRVRGE